MAAGDLSPRILAGWEGDDHTAALAVYSETVDLLDRSWPRPDGADRNDPRGFFETRFQLFDALGSQGLLTGYYEPELEGRAARCPGFESPIYAMPAGMPGETPGLSRTEIEEQGALAGFELVWLRDPVEAFMAQVQGSVRVRLGTGAVLRFGHAGKNGHPYRSIGQELIARGEVSQARMSAQAIRVWCAENPTKVSDLLRHNPSFVFFRQLDIAEQAGPLGAMGRSIVAGRSLAVDPACHPLGAPVWIEMAGAPAYRRLMVAQDTGSAIKGAGRGDVFCGGGDAAGNLAGELRVLARIVTFLPRSGAPS